MKKVSFLSVVALSAVAAMVLAGAGSAAKPTAATSTPRVQSSWTAPGVVRQVGLRNYAGPNCPGKGWNCTTSTRVLQVASAGGTNLGVCTGQPAPSGPTQSCTITQTGGGTNTARCTEQSSDATASLSCVITQSGTANYAYVNQNINQGDPITTQVGTETAVVSQSGATVTNYLLLGQAANQSTKTGTVQTQNADNSANVEQTATGAGTNSAQLNQTELQKEYARGTTQNQNTTSNLPDCNPNTVLTPGPTAPNVCAVVLQHSDAGSNTNQLRQNVNQDMNSTGTAIQTQGNFAGGLDARVHQDTVSGTSSNSAALSKNQHETAAAGSTQIQHDPMSCCGFGSQDGGTNNTENISLSSAESATGDSSPEQTSDLIGTSHTPQGACTITEKASINQSSANNSDTLNPCPFLTLQTSCNVEGCSASPPDLTNPAPPESSLSKQVASGNSGFANAIDVLGGGTVDYQLVYGNFGTGPAHNVVVTDTLPADATYVADSCSPAALCSYNSDTRTITWTLGTIFPTIEIGTVMGFSATIPNETADIVNTASVNTQEEGAIPSNSATVHDTLAAPLSGLTKFVRTLPSGTFASSTGVIGGGTVEYQINYSNSGNGDAHNVVITDVVPSGLTYVDASCTPACTYNPDTHTITWDLGTVSPTGEFPMQLGFQASVPNTNATYNNTANGVTTEEPSFSSPAATVSASFLG